MKGLLQKLYPSKLKLTGKSLLKPSSALGLVSSFIALKFLEARENPVSGPERNVDFNAKLLGKEFESEFQELSDQLQSQLSAEQKMISGLVNKTDLSGTVANVPSSKTLPNQSIQDLTGNESGQYSSFFTSKFSSSLDSPELSEKVRAVGFVSDLTDTERFEPLDSFIDSLSENLKELIEQLMQDPSAMRPMQAELTVNEANPINVAYARVEPTEVGPLMLNIELDLERISENKKTIESSEDTFILGVDVSIGICSVASASANGLEVIAHPISKVAPESI